MCVGGTKSGSAAPKPWQVPVPTTRLEEGEKLQGHRQKGKSNPEKKQRDMTAKQKPPTALRLGITTEINACEDSLSWE